MNSIEFGEFRLYPTARRLEKNGAALRIGGRALDILIVLIANAGSVVSTHDLIRCAWPETNVVEGNLRVQLTALRRILGSDPAQYISTVSGRGYSFIAPITKPSTITSAVTATVMMRRMSLPVDRQSLVGRGRELDEVVEVLARTRFVTLVGPAGIGKTVLAVRAGQQLSEAFKQEVYFVDLSAVRDPAHVTGALTNALGISGVAGNIEDLVVNFAGANAILLLLDNCEHMIEVVAHIIEPILKRTNAFHVLATSREPLRVKGEHVYLLEPLLWPEPCASLNSAEAMSYPAIELFVERVTTHNSNFSLTDCDAEAAAKVCASVDGVPLAIEIAAGRVHAFGVQKTADLLRAHPDLSWEGGRTALPRQRTLNAALAWSYDLLPARERQILERLSVFAGAFSLEAAQFVAASEVADDISDTLVSLVAKSLISPSSKAGRFRLLQMTRAFASERLAKRSTSNKVALRHARYFGGLLKELNRESSIGSIKDAYSTFGEHLDNVRTALDWSFSENGDCDLARSLAACSALLFTELALYAECRDWMARAIELTSTADGGDLAEMRLQGALGVGLLFTIGNLPKTREALERSLEIALELDDQIYALGIIGMLNIFHQRGGNNAEVMRTAHQCERVANATTDPHAKLMAQWTLGVSLYICGDFVNAQPHCETALLPTSPAPNSSLHFLGYDHRVRALVAATTTLLYRGYSLKAIDAAYLTTREAEHVGQPLPMCLAYLNACYVFIFTGEHDAADNVIDRALACAEKYSLTPFRAAALGMRGAVQIARGDVLAGIPLVQDSLAILRRENLKNVFIALSALLSLAQIGLRRFDDAVATLDAAIALCETHDDTFSVLELLRIRAYMLECQSAQNLREVEHLYSQALDLSRHHKALALELRASTSLAELWLGQGKSTAARDLLSQILSQFSEGFQTPDLTLARTLIARSNQRHS